MTDPTAPNHDEPAEGPRDDDYSAPGGADTACRPGADATGWGSPGGAGTGGRHERDLASSRACATPSTTWSSAPTPTVKEYSVKAAELAAIAADKAAPLARKAGEATADASSKLAEKSRAWAAERAREPRRGDRRRPAAGDRDRDAAVGARRRPPTGRADADDRGRAGETAGSRRRRSTLYFAAMSVRPIVMLGDPRLRLKGQPVDSFGKYLHELLDDLAHTMRDAPGVGLAAPQLGEALQACVIEVESQLHELVNPRIVRSTGDDRDLEGCLSIPGYVAYVTRREKVWVVAQDRHGQKIKVAGSGPAGPGAPARARPPRRQALHRLPRLDGRADAGRRRATRTTPRSARRRAPSRDRRGPVRRGPSSWGAARSAVPSLRRAGRASRPSSSSGSSRRRRAGRAGAGRSTPTPIHDAADALGVAPVLTPGAAARAGGDRSTSSALEPDLLVLADYGRIVPPALLEPRHGALNLHPSLLPRHRGATPIPADDPGRRRRTGVTLMRMDAGPRHRADRRPASLGARRRRDGARARGRAGRRGAPDLLDASLGPWLGGELTATPAAGRGRHR